MHKIFSTTLFFCMLTTTALAQLTQPYVRKKIQPNFFIPEGALAESTPEKVSIPKYRKGMTTAKRITPEAEQRTIKQVQKQTIKQRPQDKDKNPKEVITTQIPTSGTVDISTAVPQQNIDVNTETPNYQNMYQDYLKDLDSIARNGTVSTSQIDKDLSSMSSDKRILIDQNFNNQRHVKEDIMNALSN